MERFTHQLLVIRLITQNHVCVCERNCKCAQNSFWLSWILFFHPTVNQRREEDTKRYQPFHLLHKNRMTWGLMTIKWLYYLWNQLTSAAQKLRRFSGNVKASQMTQRTKRGIKRPNSILICYQCFILGLLAAWRNSQILGATVKLGLFSWVTTGGETQWAVEEHGRQTFIRKWLFFSLFSFWNTPHMHDCSRSCGSSFHLGGRWRKVQARAHKTCLGAAETLAMAAARMVLLHAAAHNEPPLWGW